jgi:diaminopimelate decarboxylase
MEFVREIAPETGVEAASMGEVQLALNAGYRPDQVVYDSPVKTMADLRFTISNGVRLNIDNFSELERVRQILETEHPDPPDSIGLRINPQIGTGTILESSVAGEYSKFGVPLKHRRTEIVEAFRTCSWLNGVHLHVGSQGCPVQMLTDGIGLLYDLVTEINPGRVAVGFPPVSVFDIGGGLPVSYHPGVTPPSMQEYTGLIAGRAPELFNPAAFKIITEFGRWSYTNPGWTVSRVEYVKEDPGVKTAMIHAGADLFVRECLNPADWSHEYSVFDPNGKLKHGCDDKPYNLAGPLCFSGDILAKNVPLPKIEEGDYLVIHDTGSYTFSMWSRYNSRQTPRIIGYLGDVFEVIKERGTMADLAGCWE